uniref:N-acetylmuramoyl-L-alanine amidase family protein n=1 Tax=Deinococcus sp. TaxID=47478 RepID=UPI002869D774
MRLTLRMRQHTRFLAALLLLAVPGAQSVAPTAPSGAPDVFVAYPDAGATVAFDHVILEGSVSPGGDLRIDGKAVKVGPDGLFMEWWPLRPGVNDLRLRTTRAGRVGTGSVHLTRTVPRSLPTRPTAIKSGSVTPRLPQTYWDAANDLPADRALTVSFQGSPGGRAAYRLAGSPPVPMSEGPTGTYTALYTLPSTARLLDAAFTVSLRGQDGRAVTATAPGRLSSTPAAPRVATQKAGSVQGRALNDAVTLLTDVSGRPLLYPRDGMAFTAVGRVGEDIRVRLAPGISALATAEQLDLTTGRIPLALGGPVILDGSGPPDGPVELASTPVPRQVPALLAQATPPPTGDGDLGVVLDLPPLPDLTPLPDSHLPAPDVPSPPTPTVSRDLRVRVPLGGVRVPYTVEQRAGGSQVLLTLYGIFAAPLGGLTNTADPLLQSVDVQPGLPGVTLVTLTLAAGQAWGFQAGYENGDLVVTIRRRPMLDSARPLLGRVITLDPGHGGSQKGGAGSLRVPEKNLVLPIALRVAALLRAQGA